MPKGKPRRERRVRQQRTGSIYYNGTRGRWQGTVELPPEVVDLLRAYCEKWAARQLRAGRVFATRNARPPAVATLYQQWRRILARCGVPYFRPYDLRHFAASWWLDEGISLAAVSAALGHSTQTTTARVYSHKLRRSESRIAGAGGKLLRMGKQEEKEGQA